MKSNYRRFTFEIAGYSEQDTMWFEPGPCECGYIIDGVSFGHDGGAGYVVDFKDLEKCYLAAKTHRERLAAGENED